MVEEFFEKSIANLKENEIMIVGKDEAKIAVMPIELLNKVGKEFISKSKIKGAFIELDDNMSECTQEQLSNWIEKKKKELGLQ